MPPSSDVQAREVFHFLFLEQLQRCCDPRLFVLKGGVNLRFFFGSPRYSEDLDLDVLAGATATLTKNGYKVLRAPQLAQSLAAYGITDLLINDPKAAKQTSTTQRFKVRLVTAQGVQLPSKIEFSRRPVDDPYLTTLIPPEVAARYHRVALRCQHDNGASAALQKLRALAGRTITQARDLLDLFILYAGNHFTAQTCSRLDAAVRRRAKTHLASISYAQYQDQVSSFLAAETRASYQSETTFLSMRDTLSAVIAAAAKPP